MDKEIKTLGMVIRTSDYKENDKMATLLTRDFGRLDVSMRGCKKQGGSLQAASMQFCYGDFLLYCAGSRISVTSCNIKHSFYNLCEDVDRFGAAAFITQVSADVASPMEEHAPLFALVINLLSFLEDGAMTAKEALFCFCIKVCDIFGVRPELFDCAMCGETGEPYGFSIVQGGVVCKNCAKFEPVNPIKGDQLQELLWVLGTKNSELKNLKEPDDYLLRLILKYTMVNLSVSSKRLEFLKKIRLVRG